MIIGHRTLSIKPTTVIQRYFGYRSTSAKDAKASRSEEPLARRAVSQLFRSNPALGIPDHTFALRRRTATYRR